MSRQVRITISDEAWAKVSALAALRHLDRGALVDEIILAFAMPVVTNIGPDQQADAHQLAREHARRVAHEPPRDFGVQKEEPDGPA